MMETINKEKIEVVYTKAKLGKRFLAYFIDIGAFLLTTFILYSLINMGITKAKFYTEKQEQLVQMRNDSGLYIDNVDVITYVSDDSSFPTYEDKNNCLKTRIDNFYDNPTYFSATSTVKEDYKTRRSKKYILNSMSERVYYFIEAENSYSENPLVSKELIFKFYKEEVNNYSLAYLIQNPTYFALTRFSFWTTIIEFLILGTISFTLYFLVFPLWVFDRGRQTLGMKLENIGLITVRAENESAGKYVGRFFFMYFVMIFLNLASFLIPSFVSIGMTFISKSNSSLVNYVFNDYCVDVTNQKIYYNDLEREEALIKLQQISIENKDLKLK